MRHTNGTEPIVMNGRRRHGQYEWHNADCEIQYKGIEWSNGTPHKLIWCVTHGQWAIETIVEKTFTFEDGQTITKEVK